MDATTRTSLVVLATLATGAALYWLRDVLAPFALAVFLWLVIDSFADAIYGLARAGKRQLVSPRVSLGIALVIVAAGAVAAVMVIADSAAEFAGRSDGYRERLDAVIAGWHARLQQPLGLSGEPPSARELFARLDMQTFLGEIARTARSLISNGILICIYVALLFAAEASFKHRIDALFPHEEERVQARETLGAVRGSVEQFLWVQTWTGAIPAAIAWVVLEAVGLDNALFWAFLIFLVSYVPTIGPIVATILPTLFALVQFDEPWRIAAVAAGAAVPLFVMGNIIQPRVQGETLNLSTIVVLLGLAVWGQLWGITGMFLSSPLMVAIMVTLAQHRGSYRLAVLMSADGKPDKRRAALYQERHAASAARRRGRRKKAAPDSRPEEAKGEAS